jgi:signal peptidase
MGQMAKILKIVGWAATGGIVLVIAGLAFIHFTPGYSFSLVKSGSMTPTIHVGDMIVTRPVNAADVRPGTIVMYQHNTELITHRILSVSGDSVTTKGDALQHADAWTTPASEVKGIYLFKIPYLGYAVNFMRTKLGWFVAIIIPAMFILGLFVKDILKEAFKDDKKAANSGGLKPVVKANETKNPAG